MNKFFVELGGKEFEICYNTKAMVELEKICDNLSNIGEWINNADSDSKKFTKLCNLVTTVINGAIYRHNTEIILGLKEGEKKPFVDDELIACIATPAELLKASETVFDCIGTSIRFRMPDGAPEPDPDLLETESEKKD